MVTIERTFDINMIKSIVCHDDIYGFISDDYSPLADEYDPFIDDSILGVLHVHGWPSTACARACMP